ATPRNRRTAARNHFQLSGRVHVLGEDRRPAAIARAWFELGRLSCGTGALRWQPSARRRETPALRGRKSGLSQRRNLRRRRHALAKLFPCMCAEEGLERKTDRIGGVDSGRCSDLKNFDTLR